MDNTVPQMLSVSDLNKMVRIALERAIPSCWIRGEISNLSKSGAGHLYFTLKDAAAAVRCVMFKTRSQFLDWAIKEGDKVELRAQVSVYEPRGDFQLLVDAIRQTGQGQLFEAYLALKAKLQAEGLFAEDHKISIPIPPKRLGIVTSLQAAGLQDVLATLRRRWPLAKGDIYPTAVQGLEAVNELVNTIALACKTGRCDVLILARGGGSLEDLQAFNSEEVARAIAHCAIPVVSGIGHETDFTIADFVADLRAPTPTAAAEIVTPDISPYTERLKSLSIKLKQGVEYTLRKSWQGLDEDHGQLRHPKERLEAQRRELAHLIARLTLAHVKKQHNESNLLNAQINQLRLNRHDFSRSIESVHLRRAGISNTLTIQLRQYRLVLEQYINQLSLLNPKRVLERGYSIIRTQSGEVISSHTSVHLGQALQAELANGKIRVEVIASMPE